MQGIVAGGPVDGDEFGDRLCGIRADPRVVVHVEHPHVVRHLAFADPQLVREVIGACLEPSAVGRAVGAWHGDDPHGVRASAQRDDPIARVGPLLNHDVDAQPRESGGKVIAERADDPLEGREDVISPDSGHQDNEQFVERPVGCCGRAQSAHAVRGHDSAGDTHGRDERGQRPHDRRVPADDARLGPGAIGPPHQRSEHDVRDDERAERRWQGPNGPRNCRAPAWRCRRLAIATPGVRTPPGCFGSEITLAVLGSTDASGWGGRESRGNSTAMWLARTDILLLVTLLLSLGASGRVRDAVEGAGQTPTSTSLHRAPPGWRSCLDDPSWRRRTPRDSWSSSQFTCPRPDAPPFGERATFGNSGLCPSRARITMNRGFNFVFM